MSAMTISDTNFSEFIKGVWTKRPNPMHVEQGEQYPSSVTSFMDAEIDGCLKAFRVVTREHVPPSEKSQLPSVFQPHDRVSVFGQQGVVQSVRFSASKTTYDVALNHGGEPLQNVDSVFVGAPLVMSMDVVSEPPAVAVRSWQDMPRSTFNPPTDTLFKSVETVS